MLAAVDRPGWDGRVPLSPAPRGGPASATGSPRPGPARPALLRVRFPRGGATAARKVSTTPGPVSALLAAAATASKAATRPLLTWLSGTDLNF